MRPTQRLTGRHGALLVVNLQEKLMTRMTDRDRVVKNIVGLIRGAKALGVPVWATEQYPRALGPTVAEVAALVPRRSAKTTFHCCTVPTVLEQLYGRHVRHVTVVGIEAHVCVAQTVLELLDMGFRVQVPADAVTSRRKLDWEFALRRLEHAGAVVSTTESALFEMDRVVRPARIQGDQRADQVTRSAREFVRIFAHRPSGAGARTLASAVKRSDVLMACPIRVRRRVSMAARKASSSISILLISILASAILTSPSALTTSKSLTVPGLRSLRRVISGHDGGCNHLLSIRLVKLGGLSLQLQPKPIQLVREIVVQYLKCSRCEHDLAAHCFQLIRRDHRSLEQLIDVVEVLQSHLEVYFQFAHRAHRPRRRSCRFDCGPCRRRRATRFRAHRDRARARGDVTGGRGRTRAARVIAGRAYRRACVCRSPRRAGG